MTDLETIKEKFPFITGIRTQATEYIGIVHNNDDKIISFYDYGALKSAREKQLFLSYGEIWWWESNRILPISIFMQGQMDRFRYCLKNISNKDIEILFGPVTSLNNIMTKRIKKRQIQLVRRSDY